MLDPLWFFKRFFVLDKGILVYGKSLGDINRGKMHGSIDIGLSVVSSKVSGCRIDIDAEEFIFHLKAKAFDTFAMWLRQLKEHRLHRQHLLSYGTKLNSIDQHSERTLSRPPPFPR